MSRNQAITFVLFVLASIGGGCFQSTPGGPGGSSEIWTNATKVPLLDQFQGRWQFDLERTLAAWKMEGISEESINLTRASSEKSGKLHDDITIAGHVVTCAGPLGSEYRLFALHSHDGNVCGKAWHHEDPSDYGDMSKCYVKLNLVKDELHFRVRMQDGLPALNDPDLTGAPPITAKSAQGCDADQPAGADWLEWTTYVFVRPAGR